MKLVKVYCHLSELMVCHTFYLFATREAEQTFSQPCSESRRNDFVQKRLVCLHSFLQSGTTHPEYVINEIRRPLLISKLKMSHPEGDATCSQESALHVLTSAVSIRQYQGLAIFRDKSPEVVCGETVAGEQRSWWEEKADEWKRANTRDQESNKEKKINI